MRNAPVTKLRIAGLMLMAIAIAQCGGNDVHITPESGVRPARGTFTGTTSAGDPIVIEVGSIEAISFECDGESIQETFDPPQPLNNDGTFDVSFFDGGRKFRVTGQFPDNDTVEGNINDADNRCDDSFDGVRGGIGPTRTPTPGGKTPTPTPTIAVPIETSTAPIETATKTPTPIVTATPKPCPVGVEVVGNSGSAAVLDSGWTGLGFHATVVSDGKLTFDVACSKTTAPCGQCNVSGPVANANADHGDIDSQRCTNDTSIECTSNADCSGGTCAFFFGAPLPLSAGGISTCVTNQVAGPVTGTANVESGAFAGTINLISNVFTTVETARPCPQCVGDTTPNDGVRGGTCNDGPRLGQACDINGKSPIPSFGNTSFDCPPVPGANIGTLSIVLAGSSGTQTMTLTPSDSKCRANLGPGSDFRCFCETGGGTPSAPNACRDLVCADSNGGECSDGPLDPHCKIETFRGCTIPTQATDCPAPGDSCSQNLRPCFLDNGVIGGTITAQGKADPPDSNGRANPTLASLFCIAETRTLGVNAAAGLPGPGRLQLPLLAQEILP